MHINQVPLWIAETNCWIVSRSARDDECVLIDVPPDPTAILSVLRKNGLSPSAIIATHGHVDHVGGIGELSRTDLNGQPCSLPVSIHNSDLHLLLDPIGNSGLLGEELEKLHLDVRPPELISHVSDGERINGAGLTFTAIHTPGHTEGSTCFLLTDDDTSERLLFTGDHLFKGSIGRTDLPGGSYDKLMESMKSKILPLPDELIVLPGHGPSTQLGHEKNTNPFILQMI